MKRFLMCLLLALLVPTGVFAESSTIPGATYTDEARKDRDVKYEHPNIANVTLIPGNAFTSSAQDTRGWNWMAVAVYIAPEPGSADSAAYAVFAVMPRGGIVAATDTMSSAPWITPNPARGAGAGATASYDTVGTMFHPFPVGTASDIGGSLPGVGSGSYSSYAALLPGELLCVIKYADGKRSGYFMLESNGQYFRSPFTSIRIRPLYARGGTSFQNFYTTVPMTFRVDLVGGR